MGDGHKTMVECLLDEKDTTKVLYRIANNLDGTSRSIEEINKQFVGIAARLKDGDKTMDNIQHRIDKLPCKSTPPSCPNPRTPWGKTKATAVGGVLASIIIVIVEVVKKLMP